MLMEKLVLNNNFIRVIDDIVRWKDIYIIYYMSLEEFEKKYDMERYIIRRDAYINKYNISEFIITDTEVAINFNTSTESRIRRLPPQTIQYEFDYDCALLFDLVLSPYNDSIEFNKFILDYKCYVRNKKLNELIGYGLIKI